MASGMFSKQAIYFTRKYINDGTGDSQIGGALTTAPSGIGATQFIQDYPGDRIILNAVDALAYSNNSVGNLYCGAYRYVATRNNSTSSPTRARAAFWDPTSAGSGNNISSSKADAMYQVTSDGNNSTYLRTLFAGVYINNITAGNYWWIQESGKAYCKFMATITGTPAAGVAVFLESSGAANNNATDNGAFDQYAGANAAGLAAAANFYATVGDLLCRYVGVAEVAPTNNNISLVDLTMSRTSFRLG